MTPSNNQGSEPPKSLLHLGSNGTTEPPKPKNKRNKNKNKKQNGKLSTSTSNGEPSRSSQSPTISLPHLHNDILTSLNGAIFPEPVFVHMPAEPDVTTTAEPLDAAGTVGEVQIDSYSTNIISKFTCINPSCSKQSWGSGRVAILMRQFDLDTDTVGYNATVYNQRCKGCRKLGVMAVDEGVYVERVAYRLKKWAGVAVDQPPYHGEKGTPPHEWELCEGCKRGVCPARRGGVGVGFLGTKSSRIVGPSRSRRTLPTGYSYPYDL